MMTPANLQAFRKRLGLSQPQLAKLLPASQRTVENWEQGCRQFPDYLLRALRDVERELESKPLS